MKTISTTISGVYGNSVTLSRFSNTCVNVVIIKRSSNVRMAKFDVANGDDYSKDFYRLAIYVYGSDPKREGQPCCTNSELTDLLDTMERLSVV